MNKLLYICSVLKNDHYLQERKKIILDFIILCITIISIFFYLSSIDAGEFLYAFSRNHEHYNLDEIILTVAVSSILFIIFILRRLYEVKQLMIKANSDHLTGIYNRRKGAELIKYEKNRILDLDSSSSLIMFDIDDFKIVNDTYGHEVGDTVLIEIILLLENIIRDKDSLIRWGGEEFMLLCPNTNLDDAYKFALKLKEAIQAHKFQCNKTITSSFGVIELNKEDELRLQIRNLDEKLYSSKHNGKNIVTK